MKQFGDSITLLSLWANIIFPYLIGKLTVSRFTEFTLAVNLSVSTMDRASCEVILSVGLLPAH